MTVLSLTVNGEAVKAEVEPRTHLADFLREQLRLTGTHLGCEHGVCGACTVLLDGEPVRGCITFAAACEGREVCTVEGFGDDPVMAALRQAFTEKHGLQCGFCTPGMLIAARDIVLRVPEADPARIRHELAGNLCRCTGYLGIVNAVSSVIEARRSGAIPAAASAAPAAATTAPMASFSPAAAATPISVKAEEAPSGDETRAGWTRFEESFALDRPPAEAWDALKDFALVASCLPGAELLEQDGGQAKGRMKVRLGPISASFAGSATVAYDEAVRTGRARGAGSDGGSGSRTKAEAVYRVEPGEGTGSRVSLRVEYNLQGPLAQFSRSGLAQDLGRRLIGEFAANLNARLGGDAGGSAPPASLNAGGLLWQSFGARWRALLARLGLVRDG